MNTNASKETMLQKTLYILVRQVGFSAEDVASLRLSDLHLAGKSPNISFTPAKGGAAKTVDLDLDAHRALVGWLVARPDSASDFLFLDDDSNALEPAAVEQAVKQFEQSDAALDSQPVEPEQPDTPESEETADDSAGMPESQEPPPFAPASVQPPVPPRPTAPPSAPPETGVPARPAQPYPPPPRPPVSGPEENRLPGVPQPLPGAPQPLPGTQPPGRTPDQPPPPAGRPGAMPQPVKPGRPKVPPKPVRKKDDAAAPEIMQQKEPEQAKISDSVVPPPVTPVEKESPKTPETPASEAEGPSKGIKPYKTSAQQSPDASKTSWREAPLSIMHVTLGSIMAVLAVCVICGGGVGLFALRTETGAEVLAGLGLSDIIPSGTALDSIAGDIGALPTPSPMATVTPTSTSTLPPTHTHTPPPITDTPIPADTPTPVPSPTEVPLPTDTPVPTDTPLPTDTPTPEPPAATAPPAETPTPENTPTPAMKYDAPVLLEPENDFDFIGGNTIVLRWQPVELEADEQYAVRLRYKFNGEITYQGANIKESEWTVPLALYGQVDPPENLYEWFVVVERLNEDGSGTAISPESDVRTFTWK